MAEEFRLGLYYTPFDKRGAELEKTLSCNNPQKHRYIPPAIVFKHAGTNAPSQPGILEDGENMTIPLGEKKFWKRAALASAAMVSLLAFGATPRASASDYDGCQRRIYKADHKLHEAIEHHGWYSRQAEHARHELREARERCWNEPRSS